MATDPNATPAPQPQPQDNTSMTVEPVPDGSAIQDASGQVKAPQYQLPTDKSPQQKSQEVETASVNPFDGLGVLTHILPKDASTKSQQFYNEFKDQQAGDKIYSDWLYKTHPDEYRQANPTDFIVRSAHDMIDKVAEDSIRGTHPELAEKVRPLVHSLANMAATAYGLPAKGGVGEADMKSGTVAPKPEAEGGVAVAEPEESIATPEPTGKLDVQGPSAGRLFVMEQAKKILSDPASDARDREIAQSQIDDLRQNPEHLEGQSPKEIVERAGGVHRGDKGGLTEITLPPAMTKSLKVPDKFKNHISVTLPTEGVTERAVKAALQRKYMEMGGKGLGQSE